jgi:predicted  nucleic acid-binding Zn-ribbon protein
MDKIGAWITERCEVDPKAVTPFADLYADYEAWCREQGDEPMSKRRFGDRLSEKGFPPTPQPLPGGVKARKGLRLRPDQSNQPTDFPNNQSCADCADVPNFQYNPIETEKLPRDIQSSAQEHNGTNLPSDIEVAPEKSENGLQQSEKFVDTEAFLDELCAELTANQPEPTEPEPNDLEVLIWQCERCGRVFERLIEADLFGSPKCRYCGGTLKIHWRRGDSNDPPTD